MLLYTVDSTNSKVNLVSLQFFNCLNVAFVNQTWFDNNRIILICCKNSTKGPFRKHYLGGWRLFDFYQWNLGGHLQELEEFCQSLEGASNFLITLLYKFHILIWAIWDFSIFTSEIWVPISKEWQNLVAPPPPFNKWWNQGASPQKPSPPRNVFWRDPKLLLLTLLYEA